MLVLVSLGIGYRQIVCSAIIWASNKKVAEKAKGNEHLETVAGEISSWQFMLSYCDH